MRYPLRLYSNYSFMTILCGFLPLRTTVHSFTTRNYVNLASRARVSLVLQQQQRHLGSRTATTRTCQSQTTSATEAEPHQSIFLDQVEQTVERVLQNYSERDDILTLPPNEREAVGVARNLRKRINALTRNRDCRRCWLQQKHCYCSKCPPIQSPVSVKRLFVLMHHKEICLAVDTARLLLSTFPETCRLVVGGIGPEHQASMAEIQQAMKGNKCMVLFPTDDAQSFAQLAQETDHECQDDDNTLSDDGWDVIVIDGTWSQARKLYSRYITLEVDGGPCRVQLSDDALARLSRTVDEESSGETISVSGTQVAGHQLRRHPIQWKEISTLEATRLLFNDMATRECDVNRESWPWNALSSYQQIADAATRTQLGPHR